MKAIGPLQNCSAAPLYRNGPTRNYELRNATGKWSCAHIEEPTVSHIAFSTGNRAEEPQGLDTPFHSSFGLDSRDEEESNHYGTVVINRSTCN